MNKTLQNTKLIILKELRSFYNSAIAYIVMIVFLCICGYFYSAPIWLINQTSIRHFIELVPLFYLFFIPAITMRSFAEEFKMGTIEILSTLPIKEYEILLGKYLASVVFLSITLIITLIYPLTLNFFGKVDLGTVFVCYLSLILLGGMFLSIGIFSSVLTRNQIVAYIIAFLLCFFLFVIGKTTILLPSWLATIFDFLGIDSHFENSTKGVLDTRDILYYISLSTIFIFSSYRLLISRK